MASSNPMSRTSNSMSRTSNPASGTSNPVSRTSNYVVVISFISALGGYLFGFDFAVISGALPFQFHLTPWWEGFLTGSLALGCIIGCLIAGRISDQYGRKPGLMLSAIIFAISSLGMAWSSQLSIFIGMRFAAGIGVGMASMLSPMYISEISPAESRGRNVAINQLTIVIGILLTNLINYTLSGHGTNAWRWMFGLGVVPSLLFLVGIYWLPESPRWLLKTGRTTEAKKILFKIGGEPFAKNTALSIQQNMDRHSHTQTYASVFNKSARPAVMVGVVLAILQQFCGINVVFNYTSTIFKAVGANLDRQLFETVCIGAVNLIFTLLAMWQVDRIGRRPLMLIGSLGLSLSYIILSILLQNNAATGIISVFILLAIAIYATTIAPVFWVIISEIFPGNIRGHATSVAVIALWASYFVLVFTFPVLAKELIAPGYFFRKNCVRTRKN